MSNASKMFNIRLTPDEAARLQRLVERENDRAEAAGFPRDITASGILRRVIHKAFEEYEKPAEASHINAALEKLRAAR